MKPSLLITLFIFITASVFAQDQNKPDTPKTNSVIDKITVDTCCCKVQPTCIIDGKKIKTNDIVVDFRSKDIGMSTTIKSIRKGDYVRVKVMNYNPYLYKLFINNSDSSVATPVDLSFLPKFFDPTNLSTFVGGLIDKTGIAPLPGMNLEMLSGNNNDSVIAANGQSQAVYDIDDCLIKKKNKIDTAATVQCLKKFYSKLAFVLTLLEMQIDDFGNQIDEINFEFTRKFSARRNLYPDCKSFSKDSLDKYAEKLKSDLLSLQDDLLTLRGTVMEQSKDYDEAIARFTSIIAATPLLKLSDSYVRKFYEEADSSIKKFKTDIGYKNIADMMASLENLSLPSSCYVSFPIFIADDVKKINIDLRSRADSLGVPDYSTTLIIPPFQQKIWGVSAGTFITPLKNENYGIKTFTQPRTGGGVDTLHNLIKDGNGAVQVGIDGLAYTGWKINADDNKPDYFGISFGAGMSIESKPKPRILLGGAFISGEKNRIMISAGFVLGNVKQLSNAFNETTNYTQLPTDFMKDVIKLNGFLSINYSFLSK